MKKVLVVVAAVITMAVMPICADAHVVKCANGTYILCTVDEEYFASPDEYKEFCEELAIEVCKQYGSVSA